MYRYFDFCISSELPLPALPECEGDSPAWSIVMAVDAGGGQEFVPFHSWKAPNGQEIMVAACCGDSYLVEFPGLARFVIDFPARCVEAQPLAGCADNTLAHLLVDQVLPRAVCHQGQVVLHASAVLAGDGRAIAFAGPSGWGKSTLAAAFHRAAYPLLTDDCLLLKPQGEAMLAIPAYPSLRLWPDSLEAICGDTTGVLSDMAHYTDKQQLLLKSEWQPAPGQWPELAVLFLLGDSAGRAASGEIRIERAAGTATLIALLESLFALDVVDRDAVQRSFERVGRMSGRVPVFQLAYPRDYRELSQVIARISVFDPTDVSFAQAVRAP